LPIYTEYNTVREILSRCSPYLSEENAVIYDLGAGDGRFVIEAARLFPESTAKGLEINPQTTLITNERIKLEGINNVTILAEDAETYDFSDGTFFIMNLTLTEVEAIKGKFTAGQKVVTIDQKIPDWDSKLIDEFNVTGSTPGYVVWFWGDPADYKNYRIQDFNENPDIQVNFNPHPKKTNSMIYVYDA
jgi:hypothetical protein